MTGFVSGLRVWAFPWLLLLACSGGDGDGGGGAGAADGGGGADEAGVDRDGPSAAPVPFSQACDVYQQDLCRALVACVPQAPYRTVADCLAEEDCLGRRELGVAITSGAVEYRPEGAGRCHAIANADICAFANQFGGRPTVWQVLAACPGALVGKRVRGASCRQDFNCTAGLFCAHTGDTCDGVCEPWRSAGQSCDDDSARCGSGLECAPDGCHPTPAREGDTCWADNQCRTKELYCDTATRACRRRPSAGEPCGGTFDDCGAGLNCQRSAGGTPAICRPAPGQGETCHFSANPCQPGLFCAHNDGIDKPGVCFRYGGVGMACQGPGGVSCEAALVCHDDGICAPPHQLAEPCSYSWDCARGLRCADGRCTDQSTIGLACDLRNPCSAGLCRAGKCEPLARVSQVCMVNDDCRSGHCDRGICADHSSCR
jgi:hypothetical protein